MEETGWDYLAGLSAVYIPPWCYYGVKKPVVVVPTPWASIADEQGQGNKRSGVDEAFFECPVWIPPGSGHGPRKVVPGVGVYGMPAFGVVVGVSTEVEALGKEVLGGLALASDLNHDRYSSGQYMVRC